MAIRSTAARFLTVGGCWAVATALAIATPPGDDALFENGSGHSRTFSVNGPIDPTNPFFQAIGTNGRSCDTCHQAADGWSITPAHVRARFNASTGLDPIFRLNDGSNSPHADISTPAARRDAFNMLLTRGLIRVGIGIPEDAEFELVDVDDPYGFASAAELSLFRRPLPTTNLAFLSAVMWDGRETFADQSMHFNLGHQANGATVGHAQSAAPLTDEQRERIVAFELGLYTAQVDDRDAGELNGRSAHGGPAPIASLPFFIGVNDALGPNFDRRAFTLFDAWADLKPAPRDDPRPRAPLVGVRDHRPGTGPSDERYLQARRSIARGQEIFNTHEFDVRGVNGLNDVLGVPALRGTCTTCHNTPNVGDHSTSLPLDLGISAESRRTPDMPLYTLRNTSTGEIVRTTDPGRALVTGRWRDMSLFKGPILRGLSSRPPYFHNGSAATLDDVVDFYDSRFAIGLNRREKADLVAFLKAL
jgi:hypothetical protein